MPQQYDSGERVHLLKRCFSLSQLLVQSCLYVHSGQVTVWVGNTKDAWFLCPWHKKSWEYLEKKSWEYFRYQLVWIVIKGILNLHYYSVCMAGKYFWNPCHSSAFLPKIHRRRRLFSCKCRHAHITLDACCLTRRIWQIKEFRYIFPMKKEMFKVKWVDRKMWGKKKACA